MSKLGTVRIPNACASTVGRAGFGVARLDPDTVNAPTRAYRARKHAASGFHTPQQAKARREFFGNCCWLCGVDAVALDHVKPLSRGGSDFASNLRPICKPYNTRKGNRWPLPSEWLRGRVS